MSRSVPTTIYLFWSASASDFAVHFSDVLKNCKGYTLLGSAPVNFGDVVFDEKECMLKALNQELGEAHAKVEFIKDQIQKLLAIGHEVEEPSAPIPPRPHWTDPGSFDDDIPF